MAASILILASATRSLIREVSTRTSYVEPSQGLSQIRGSDGGDSAAARLPGLHRRRGQQELLRHHQRVAPDGRGRLLEAVAGCGERSAGFDQENGDARTVVYCGIV